MPRRVFITVAEHSADQHAAKLVRRLREINPDVIVEGLGGLRLRDEGVIVHHDTVTRAAMGWQAALRAREVARLIRWTRDHFDQHSFDLQICCDSWSMNWHFARLAHDRGVPVMYYIAPQTWASREGRLRKMRRYVDRVACILPFEEQYFRRHGLDATFVGHPLFDELPAGRPAIDPSSRFPNAPPVIGLPAGSRRSVAKANFPRQVEVAREILREFPAARFVVPTTEATDAVVRETLASRGGDRLPVEVKRDAFDEMIPRCDLCVTVSGTAALHIAAYGVPMIVVYHGNPVLWHLVARWVVRTRTYSLVNLLSKSETHVAPEFIPWYGPTQPVAARAIELLKHPARLELMRAEVRASLAEIDRPGASRRAAELALAMIDARTRTGSKAS